MTSLAALLPLGLLVVLLVGALWWLQKRHRLAPGLGHQIAIKGAAMVGPRERVVLIEVEGQRVLVGVGQGTVGSMVVLGRAADAPDATDSMNPADPVHKEPT